MDSSAAPNARENTTVACGTAQSVLQARAALAAGETSITCRILSTTGISTRSAPVLARTITTAELGIQFSSLSDLN